MSDKIEGIPEGWELVRIGTPIVGESFITSQGWVKEHEQIDVRSFSNYPIVRRIEPPKPVYVPWTYETCPVGAVVVRTGVKLRSLVNFAYEDCASIGISKYDYADVLEHFTHIDGTPCGTIAEVR